MDQSGGASWLTATFYSAAFCGLMAIGWVVTSYLLHAPTTDMSPGVNRLKVEERVFFRNCAAAWKAGKAPIRRGKPGYRVLLDTDLDGVACEAGD